LPDELPRFSQIGGGATVTTQSDVLAADQTTTSTAYIDTNLLLTLANRSGGSFSAIASTDMQQNANLHKALRFREGSTNHNGLGSQQIPHNEYRQSTTLSITGLLDGDELALQFRTNLGTLTLMGVVSSGTDYFSRLEIFEVS